MDYINILKQQKIIQSARAIHEIQKQDYYNMLENPERVILNLKLESTLSSARSSKSRTSAAKGLKTERSPVYKFEDLKVWLDFERTLYEMNNIPITSLINVNSEKQQTNNLIRYNEIWELDLFRLISLHLLMLSLKTLLIGISSEFFWSLPPLLEVSLFSESIPREFFGRDGYLGT